MVSNLGELGSLANGSEYHEPLNINGANSLDLLRYLHEMLRIRFAEDCISNGIIDGLIRTPCHLAIGQEAIAVGVSANLRTTDKIFGAHRSHAHYLALNGSNLKKLFCEILGKRFGLSLGMGGSMHLIDQKIGFQGTVPIVAGTIPIALGAGLACKKKGNGDFAVAYFGDGAAEEGIIHECLNLASVWNIPIIFICENNLFSSHLGISLRQPSNRISRFADAHKVESVTLDGNDVLKISDAMSHLASSAREKSRPGFLEAVTYRWKGHVGPRDDEDVGVNRGGDLVSWKKRDPIARLYQAMLKKNYISESIYLKMQEEIIGQIEMSWSEAMNHAPLQPGEDESYLYE